ncbi:MAG: response regulator [Desulfobacteraceae bacterium]|nr:response regulator [Desulfobacteraceae bacterium]
MEKIRVLMVDDEARFRETTSKLLKKKGFEVTMAQSGEEALDIVRKHPQDVVILDIKMGGMDGHEALLKIKNIDSEIRVIMLTGHGSADSAEKALKDKAFDYLNKPCDIDILSIKIREAYAERYHLDKKKEKKAYDVMTFIENYSSVSMYSTVKEAVSILMESFKPSLTGEAFIESGHRSIIVMDEGNEPIGLLTIYDLLHAIRPAYLSAPKPSMADSVQYSSMFWDGLFTIQTKSIAGKQVYELMSETPPAIDRNANLMEVADLIFTSGRRRVLVKDRGKVIGIVREQDIFFAMVNIIV